MAKISDDGLRLTLDEAEREKVERDLLDSINRTRSGFARRECISGKHAVGTEPGCRACEQYKAGARVRKG